MGSRPRSGRSILSIVLLVLGLSVGSDQAAVVFSGDEMPRVEAQSMSVDGRLVALDHIRGDAATLVIFTSNVCPQSRGWEERIVELGNTYRTKGVITILVNAKDPAQASNESYEAMRQTAQRLELEFPYLLDEDSTIARAFGATHTPEVFLFDGGSRLVYHGAVDDNVEDPDQVTEFYLRDALEAVVVRSEIPVPTTLPVGCSIQLGE
jgi:peroxiredoxin